MRGRHEKDDPCHDHNIAEEQQWAAHGIEVGDPAYDGQHDSGARVWDDGEKLRMNCEGSRSVSRGAACPCSPKLTCIKPKFLDAGHSISSVLANELISRRGVLTRWA